MATLKVNTLSGIGTEGPVLNGGLKFRSENYMTLPKGDTTQRGRGRALFGGGYLSPGYDDGISYLQMQSQGNTVDFGSLTVGRGIPASTGSSTRGIFAGGGIPSNVTNTIDFATIATCLLYTSDAADE